jgi:hypothetical protein
MLAEGTPFALGTGLGGIIIGLTWIMVRIVGTKRNGSSSSVDRAKRELHTRVNKEVESIDEKFVRKDVCKLVSAQIKKDVGEIKAGVARIETHLMGGASEG